MKIELSTLDRRHLASALRSQAMQAAEDGIPYDAEEQAEMDDLIDALELGEVKEWWTWRHWVTRFVDTTLRLVGAIYLIQQASGLVTWLGVLYG